MECVNCEHMKGLDNDIGDMIYFCMNTESGAYLNETGICGNCELEEKEEDKDSYCEVFGDEY